VATKITVSKRLEAEIRGAINTGGASLGDDAWDALGALVALIDAAQSSQASGSGLSAAVFLGAIEAHRPVVKPPSGPIGNGAYARLSKCLRVNGVTEEQAASLGVWLAGEGLKAAPGDITIDRIIKNLGDWITRALAHKPEYNRPEW